MQSVEYTDGKIVQSVKFVYSDGKTVPSGRTIRADHRLSTFVVTIESIDEVSADEIKNLIQKKRKVKQITHHETVVVVTATSKM